MKRTIYLFLLIVGLLNAPSEALAWYGGPSEPLALDQPDRRMHVMATYGITLTTSLAADRLGWNYPILFGAGMSMLWGLGREATVPPFSSGDMKANLLGTGLGALSAYLLTFKF